MKNLKLELFNFKKNLSLDQEEISVIVEGHMNACNTASEKGIIASLNERLKPYTYDKDVRTLLESLNDDMKNFELLYELKNLYNVLNSKNGGELYRQPINVLLQTINLESDQDRMSKVLNELAVYDWVPEIKLFVHNLTKSPEKRTNLLSGGKGESIYTIVESVEDGHIALVKDAWFLLSESVIEKTLLENHIKDEADLKSMRMLETAMKYASVTEDRVNFRISEYLTIGLSVAKKGKVYINDDEMNDETTLESLFNSPIVPIVNKNFYPILLEVSQNLDKFVELDVVKRVNNLINPYLECFAFNYKNATFLYRCDERYGNSFFKYESALELVNEVRNELNYDLTYFYENKLGKELIVKRKLEDKEREVTLKLEDVCYNIEKLKGSIKMIGESEVLTTALKNLEKRKTVLDAELAGVKELQYKEMYLNNRELYIELVVSKAQGRLTRNAQKMLELLAKKTIKKMRYWSNDDKLDCYQSGLLYVFQNWYNFNEEKSVNAFAYFTEIFKRGIAKGYNDLYKKKGDNEHQIRLISIEGSNDGMGLHSL